MLESAAAKFVAVIVALALLLGGVWKLYHDIDKSGYDRGVGVAQAACEKQAKSDKAAADKQRDENLEAASKASKRAGDSSRRFETIIRGTQNELPKVTENLAACRLEPDAVRVLNLAASAAKN